jgi:hypothetical protein
MQARKKAREEVIAAAKLPGGLSLGEGKVELNGLPFSQASDAEKLKASVAVAMAMNPRLRVLRVKDGSLLDTASVETLEVMCKDGGFQLWLERIDPSGKLAIVVELGK